VSAADRILHIPPIGFLIRPPLQGHLCLAFQRVVEACPVRVWDDPSSDGGISVPAWSFLHKELAGCFPCPPVFQAPYPQAGLEILAFSTRPSSRRAVSDGRKKFSFSSFHYLAPCPRPLSLTAISPRRIPTLYIALFSPAPSDTCLSL